MELVVSTNVQEVAEALRRRGVRVLDVIEGPLDRGAIRIEAAMKVYPPKPPGSTYRRTGTLGRRWTTRPIRSANEVGREVGNKTVPYAPLVQSEELQARFHRGRWLTDAQALRNESPRLLRDVEDTLIEFMEG
jgi:hypothetical protein